MKRQTTHSTYNASAMGDTRRSPYKYVCKFCGMKNLSWGVLGEHRRLFESLMVVHDCNGRYKNVHKHCACSGFTDFEIPIEHYNDPRYERKT